MASRGGSARLDPRRRARPARRPAGGGGRPARGGGGAGAGRGGGGARGIGAATGRALPARGWSVVAVDVADPPAGERVAPWVADVTDLGALGDAVALAEERFGGLDAMIAVAGVIAGGAPHWEVPVEQERAVLDVDLGGVLNAARVGVPALLRRPEPRSGRFVAVASAAAVRGLPLLAAYCAAKAGVAGFVRALAAELGGTGVTANAVAPGSTRTAMLDETARLYGIAAEDFAAQQPLGRLLEPEEVAALIAWLASAESSGATGGLIAVDGGLAL